jgi:hypothetical protein
MGGRGESDVAASRLALRQLLGVAAWHLGGRRATLAVESAALRERLLSAVRDRLAAALPAGELTELGAALARAERPDENLATLLHDVAGGALVEVADLRQLVSAADLLEPTLAALTTPAPAGLFTLVLAPALAAEFRAPWNPFGVPVACPAHGDPLALAHGIAAARTAEATARAGALRHARHVLESMAEAGATGAPLAWSELAAEERALCAPVVVAIDSLTARTHLGALAELLAGDLPLKVAVLAGADGAADERSDPLALLAALPALHLAQSSLAAPVHLDEAAGEMLLAPGPALLRVHAPASPRGTVGLLDEARAARLAGYPLFVRPPGAPRRSVDESATATARERELEALLQAAEAERDALAAELATAPERLRAELRVELAIDAKARLLTLIEKAPAPGEAVS